MFSNNKPFGTASTFGTSTFGSTTTPFGQTTTAFGAKPATSNVFGASAFGTAAPSTSGLFGNNPPATGTGLFGQPTTAFGQPAATSNASFGFGGASTSGGLFGSATPSTQSGGLFGGSSTSAFGTPRQTFGGFGAPNTGTGLFGQTTTPGTGLFGATGGFNATTAPGTTVKFNPPTGTDTMMKGGVSTNISTRHQCITCMKEYENKSLEELRVEDYAANRKGPQAGMAGFGNPTQQTGLFGATPAASTSGFSFGTTTQAKPMFGTTGATNTFGATNSLFGQTPQTQNTGLFGKNVGFGAPTTSAAPAFNFGASTGTSLFGQNNQQKPLFGQTTAGTGLFGAPASTQPNAFGTNTAFGAFGAPAQQTGGLFGAKPTGFGATNTTTTNTFSFGNANNMTGGGLFGAKSTAPAFGTAGFGTQSTGFGFGTTPTASTGLFGQPKPATSAFGNTGTAFGTGLGTGFGTSTFNMGTLGSTTGTGLFGAANANKAPGFNFSNTGSTGFGFGSTNPNTSSFNFGPTTSFNAGYDPNSMLLQQQTQKQILAMTANPFGDSPLFRNVIKNPVRQEEVLKPTNPSAQKALLTNNHYKVSPLPAAKIKPKPLTPLPNGKVSLFDGLEDEEPSLGNATFVPKRSVKKLVLRHNVSSPSSFTLTSNLTTSSDQPTQINFSISLQKSPIVSDGSRHHRITEDTCHTVETPPATPLTVDITSPLSRITESVNANEISSSSDVTYCKQILPTVIESNKLDDTIAALHTKDPKESGRTFTITNDSDGRVSETNGSFDETSSEQLDLSKDNTLSSHPTKIVLKRPGYYTIPPLYEMTALVDNNGDCFVTDFTVGCEGYGKVTFPGSINVAGLNLDEIVEFRKKEITIYRDDENKPPIGQGLNRKAEVTLEGVWPTDKTTHELIKDPERLRKMGYIEKIEKSTTRLGAKFIDYRPDTGSWVFMVSHFSKYGLQDSDDEMEEPEKPQDKEKSSVPPKKMPKINGVIPTQNFMQHLNDPLSLQDEEEQMEGVTSDVHKDCEYDNAFGSAFLNDFYSPSRLITAGLDAGTIQSMKASFFYGDDMEENWNASVQSESRKQTTSFFRPNITDLEQSMLRPATPEVSRCDVSKRQRQLNSENDRRSSSISSPVHYSEIGIQNSMLSLSISASQSELLSSFPLMKNSAPSHAVASPSKPLTMAINRIHLKPLTESILCNKQHLIADAGYFMGRSFRVGWGPSSQLSQLQSPKDIMSEKGPIRFSLYNERSTSSKMSQVKSSFCVSLKKLHTEASLKASNIVEKNLILSLELQLKHSASTLDKGSPIFVSEPGVEPIHAMAKLFDDFTRDTDPLCSETGFVRQCSDVWNLLVSLWGNVPDLEDGRDNSDYDQQMARREALSKWLIKTTKDRIAHDINTNKNEHQGYLSTIFHLLSGRRVADAVKLAQRSDDHRLSLLISQAESNSVIRKLISKQLLNWEESGAYTFINQNRLVLYCLLAGLLIWENASETVNCCQNLDWKRALALHLWYHCLPTSSIQDAVTEYDKSYKGTESSGKYCVPPYALYIESMLNDFDEETEKQEVDSIYDTCYHLLKLYCDRSHRMDQLLMPETYTNDHLDYRLSWLLHLALSSIGYNIPKDIAYSLTLDFATQLESMNMWQWSIFVLLHLADEEWRTKHVKDVLLKYISLEQNNETYDLENFLVEQLLIPKKWLYEAKAIKAHSLGKRSDEAWYLLKAGSYSKSHNIVVKYLASESIINEEYANLLKYLEELSVPERSSTILDWASGGQVYLDYINISQTIKAIVNGEMSAYDLEEILPKVVSLCYRLSSIPAPTLKDRLSTSEMAKKTATILRSIFTLRAGRTGNSADIHTIAPHMKQLPMPYDYAIEENRLITHSCLKEITTEI